MSLTKERDGVDVETPEHDKLMAISEERRETAQEFYDFIREQGWSICRWRTYPGDPMGDGAFQILHERPEEIMGMFFGVDHRKFSDEKDAIVRALQERAK